MGDTSVAVGLVPRNLESENKASPERTALSVTQSEVCRPVGTQTRHAYLATMGRVPWLQMCLRFANGHRTEAVRLTKAD